MSTLFVPRKIRIVSCVQDSNRASSSRTPSGSLSQITCATRPDKIAWVTIDWKQIAHLDDFVDNDPTTIHSPGGYWGHLGLRLKGQNNYMWFPITAFTRNLIDQVRQREFMAVPCMDNSLLLIYCEAIEELFFAFIENLIKQDFDEIQADEEKHH